MFPEFSGKEGDDLFRRITVPLAILLGLWYLSWRLTETLNGETPLSLALSIVLFAAEVYGFIAFVLFFLQAGGGIPRKAPPLQDYPTVDIFVTVYNESVDILYRTLVCCRALDYPSGKVKVHVLDDGNRREVRDLAESMGCGYLSRSDPRFAKAGNLNHALGRTEGELIAVFDCDHIPVRSFLTETVGFFSDPEVAIVQTPHFFHNPDSFQRNLRLERELANEQDLFFRVIEPGRDRHNAAFFAGSSGLLRRSALWEIGGFQTLTLTEDLHTSMALHAMGYRSVYLPKILSAGLSPESFEGYLKQRKRWTRGAIQLFLLDNPLLRRGLAPVQRIQYFGALFHFFHGIPRIVYLTAPLAYLLFGIAPLTATPLALAGHFLPYYLASLFVFYRISGGTRNPFWSDVYETAVCFAVSVTAVATFFNPRRTRFQVTPKGLRSEADLLSIRPVAPHLAVAFLILAGIGSGLYRVFASGGGPGGAGALGTSLLWGIYNLCLIGAAVAVARERRQTRQVSRSARGIPCEIQFPLVERGKKYTVRTISCMTRNLSESGVSLMMRAPRVLPMEVQISLFGERGDRACLRGNVIRNDTTPEGEGSVGIRFTQVPEESRKILVRLMFSHPHTWEALLPPVVDARRSFLLIFTAPFRVLFRERTHRRYAPRRRWEVPCHIRFQDQVYPGISEDLSGTGMRLFLIPGVDWDGRESHREEVTIWVYPGQGRSVELPARVIRKKIDRRVTFGVRFNEVQVDLFSLDGAGARDPLNGDGVPEGRIPERSSL